MNISIDLANIYSKQNEAILDQLPKEVIIELLLRNIERVMDLHNATKEAIEYIKSYLPNYDFDKTNLKKLLEILGGGK